MILKILTLLVFLVAISFVVSAADKAPIIDLTAMENLKALSLQDLMEVEIVTVSKKKERIHDAPGVISVITAKEIEQFGANNLFQVLERLANVYMGGIAIFPQNEVGLRGDIGKEVDRHVLLLINGRRVLEGLSGGNYNFTVYLAFPVVAVEKIEIIRGPGSVLYGTNAYTGIINILTKKTANSQGTEGKLSFTKGSLGTTASEGFVALQENDLKLGAAFKTFKEDGWKLQAIDETGKLGQTNCDEDNLGGYLYGEYKNFTLDVSWLKSAQRMLGATINWNWNADTSLEKLSANLGYTHYISDNSHLELHFTHGQYVEEDGAPSSQNQSLQQDNLFEITQHIQSSEKLDWLFGATVFYGSGEKRTFNTTTKQKGFEVKPNSGKSYTLYTQLTYDITDNTTLILGGQAVKSSNLSWSYVPRIGVVHHFTDELGIKALYSEAYRSIWPTEKLIKRPVIIGNPNLEPETIATSDLQLFYVNDKHQLSLTYYHSRQHDMIQRVLIPNSIVSTYINGTYLTFQGIELEGKTIATDALFITSSLSYQTNKSAEGKKDYTLVPNVSIKLGVSYNFNSDISLGVFNNYFSDGHDARIKNSKAKIVNPFPEAFNLMTVNLNVKLNRLLGLSKKYPISLNSYVYNALDEDIYYPEMLRSVINSLPARQGRSFYTELQLAF